MFYILLFAFFVNNVKSDYDLKIECKSWISFNFDDSNVLSAKDFTTQMSFVSSIVSNLNHPERIRASGGYVSEFEWHSGLTISHMLTLLKSTQQSQSTYSLKKQFLSVINDLQNIKPSESMPVGAVFFVSDTSDSALQGADTYISKLRNITLTFICIGSKADPTKLNKYSDYVTQWNLSKPKPDNWDFFELGALGCPRSFVYSPTTSPAVSAAATTTATSNGYYPCKSFIAFVIDQSQSVGSQKNYDTQVNFIVTEIGKLNHAERISVPVVDGTEGPSWHNDMTILQLQQYVSNYVGGDYNGQWIKYSLSLELSTIQSQLDYLYGHDFDVPIATLIFISDTFDNVLAGANQYQDVLKKIDITFILMGDNVEESALTNFSTKFIHWPDLSKPKPDDWDSKYLEAYGCKLSY